MKRAVVYLFTLILVLTYFSSRAHSDNGASTPKKKDREEVINIANSLLAAIDSYKNEQRSLCVSELTKRLSFELVKDVTHQVEKSCEVDSLVVGNDELHRWGYFKSVDLEYLKDVEVVISMKTPKAKDIALTLADMLQNDQLTLTSKSDNSFEFADRQGAYVKDTRFKLVSKSYVSSRYHYQIEVLDDYLILNVKEVMSDHWVDGDEPESRIEKQIAQSASQKN